MGAQINPESTAGSHHSFSGVVGLDPESSLGFSRCALVEEELLFELQGSWNQGLWVVTSFPSIKNIF